MSPPPVARASSLSQNVGAFVGAALLGVAAWRILVIVHGWRFGELAAGDLASVHGNAFSPAFANRLLGPALLQALAWAADISPARAFPILALALLVLAQLTSVAVYRRATGDSSVALRTTALGCALCLLLTDPLWVKSWDLVEQVLFILFAYGIVTRQRLAYFALVFALDLPNRETALCIPLWLVLDSFARRPTGRWWIAKPRQLVVGLVLAAVGAAVVVGLRRWLFSGSTEVHAMTPWGNHSELTENLSRLAADARALDPEASFLLLLPAAGAYVAGHWARLPSSGRAAAVLLAAIAVANLLFATVDETRVWLICVPLVVALDLQIRGLVRTDASDTPA